MLFRSVASLVAGALFTQGAFAALTPDQVVTNIGIVTAVSGNINDALGGLTTSSTPSQVKTIAQTVTTGFQTIVNGLSGDVTAMQATPPFADGPAGAIVNALTDFVKVHQALLSTVIGKHGILAQFGVTAPVAAILSSLEAGIDSFAFAMIALIPTKSASVTDDKNSLDSSVKNTISIYQQFCLPSPLYPGLMPICASL